GDGKIDYPADPDCTSAADNIEFVNGPDVCGAQLKLKTLPANGIDMGTFDVAMSLSNLGTPCGGGGGAPAYAYLLTLTEPKVLVASTDYPATTTDTVLDLRGQMCSDPTAEIACHDDVGTSNTRSTLVAPVMPGIYYLIVEGHDTSATGTYKLTVQMLAPEGADCTMQSDCGPGLVCRIPVGGTNMICTKPVCSDGLDDDGDGKIDYPADPGCLGPTDATEDDNCPSGPGCPACADGIDNDGDGQIDYPNDPSCSAASSSSEACQEQDAIAAITSGSIADTMVGAHDDHDPDCGSNGGPDKLFTLDLPAMSTLTIDTENSAFDTLLSLLDSTCNEPSIECDDDDGVSSGASLITRTNLPAGTYIVAVDAYSSTTTVGAFNLHVSGTIAPGGSCEGQLFQAGVIACGAGFSCDGPPGAKTCRTECSDGVDNNGDGTIDYPADPGCASPADSTEDTVCPGPMCPACADGLDNDGDGKIDYPMDSSCAAASGISESCPQAETIAVITAGLTAGTTVGATNDVNPTCASSSGSGPDVALQLDVPLMETLNLDLTTGYDSVHALFDASCGGAALSCKDPTTMTLTNVAAGRYFLIVDGYSSTDAGTFVVATSGVIAPTGSCESPLFASGAFTCATGTTCGGPAGARTCRTECSDGIDNNGDGKTDYPNDPGCTSLLDSTEDTVCPGAGCPACSNGMDDDGDALTDWPADFGCISAAGPTEAFCAVETNYAGAITMPVTSGTLDAPAADDYEQGCQSDTGNDVAYSLSAPVAATWRFDTDGSTISDSVLSVNDANCGVQLACDDDSGAGNLSMITMFLPPGNYAIQVDSYTQNNNNGPFKLNVHGTAMPGAACTSPLFASGVLSCAAGQTCTAGVCQ
ncbi:MAG TPA: PPC domain-containing protein, partial [Kofleriaceae bacterium]|nr:PPC domain-containing protein [Kofleriaceae bacterium]